MHTTVGSFLSLQPEVYRMGRFLLCLVACLLFAAPVSGQVVEDQPFQVAFDHSGVNVSGYRLYVDGTPLGADLPPTPGTTTVTVPGLDAGTHTLQASAFNAGGETRGAPLTVTVTAPAPVPPAAPSNLRIVTTTALRVEPDGSVTLLASTTEVQPVP